MKESKNIKHFAGLSLLRFIAASLVIFHHVAQYKHWAGMESSWGENGVNQLGHLPVAFFFVLSGFLITYLLMKENYRFDTINLRTFYMRRILRIWPLYFIIVLVALFILPAIITDKFGENDPGTSSIFSLFLFMPNLLRITFPNLVGGNQLWSVGIEEQFYLFWPVLILIFRKNVIQFLVIFILIKLAVHLGLFYTTSLHLFFLDQQRWEQIEMLYRLFPVEQMAVGGLGAAFLFYNKAKMLTVLYHKFTLLFVLLGLAVIIIFDLHGIYVTYVEAVIFVVLIMQITQSTFAKNRLENRLFSRLGDMSFGIYMWHTIVVALLIYGLPSAFYQMTGNWGLHLLSFAISVMTAHFSYQYIESPILKLKKYYLPGAERKQIVKQVDYVQG
ncbi:MAG: acyltransferase [Cyclobacteriaceae bacterium]